MPQPQGEATGAPFVRQLHPDALEPLSLAVGKPQIARCPGQGYAAASPGEFWCFCQIDEHTQKQGFEWKEQEQEQEQQHEKGAEGQDKDKPQGVAGGKQEPNSSSLLLHFVCPLLKNK